MSPMRREAYPADWKAISASIRERAKHQCEQCGAPNHEWVIRLKNDPYHYEVMDWEDYEEVAANGWPEDSDFYPPVKVILTVHHIGVPYPNGTPGDPHDKMDCRPENLIALCQRCHLRADMALHVANAHRTRRRRKLEAGQTEFWNEEPRPPAPLRGERKTP